MKALHELKTMIQRLAELSSFLNLLFNHAFGSWCGISIPSWLNRVGLKRVHLLIAQAFWRVVTGKDDHFPIPLATLI